MKKQTYIYDLYQKGRDHHRQTSMYSKVEKYHNFYIGNQWSGLKNGDEDLPQFNFIKPIGKYKISLVAQNEMRIIYSAKDKSSPLASRICDKLNQFATFQWESSKMDSLAWRVIKNSFITGDHYLYCYIEQSNPKATPMIKMRSINKTNIYLADEQNPNLNEQEWVIISERIPVAKARAIGIKNGLTSKQVELIVSDDEGDIEVLGQSSVQVKSELGKCTSLLFMRRVAGGLEFCRSTQQVVYSKLQLIHDLDSYPVVSMRWEEKIGDSRGISGVEPLIANQLEVNKTAARRAIAVKRFSFPTLAYNENKVSNIDELSKIGSNIAVNDLDNNPISSIVQYLSPAPISADAATFQSELINLSRELEGASSAALGQIDPTKTSGEAIKAARDQSAIPLNEQLASYKQFVEDIASLWYKLLICYSPLGLSVSGMDGGDEVISKQSLKAVGVDIQVDVSPIDPYTRLSSEMVLERLLQAGHITFPEYLDSLDSTTGVPKSKLQAIISARSNVTVRGGEYYNVTGDTTRADSTGGDSSLDGGCAGDE